MNTLKNINKKLLFTPESANSGGIPIFGLSHLLLKVSASNFAPVSSVSPVFPINLRKLLNLAERKLEKLKKLEQIYSIVRLLKETPVKPVSPVTPTKFHRGVGYGC